LVAAWSAMNGKQGGDPAKLAAVLVDLAGQSRSSGPIRCRCRRSADIRGKRPRPARASRCTSRDLNFSGARFEGFVSLLLSRNQGL